MSKIDEIEGRISDFIDNVAEEAGVLPPQINEVILEMADVEDDLAMEIDSLCRAFRRIKDHLHNRVFGFWI